MIKLLVIGILLLKTILNDKGKNLIKNFSLIYLKKSFNKLRYSLSIKI